ncbi:hypothetical protein ZIOFF_027807 [Zingiber officinale]|uniref:Bromo domain-containing protein n=1 Tax=Zingiber officinale TaxID=94328 RepID=A0A8J5L9F5_ZINOF|nr:hypothetical protein ZIOFF_027807 [Zingiber officinale]
MSIVTNLRRSTRKRKMSINLEDYDTDTSASEDDDLMAPRYRSSKNKTEHNVRHDRVSASLRREKIAITNSLPRREGLRPRRSLNGRRAQPYQESEEGQDSSEDQMTEDETENGNDVDEDAVNEEDGDLGDDVAEYEDVGDQVAEDGDDEEGEEEQDGRKRYDLRNRAEVRRLIPEKEGKQKSQSPRKSLHQGVSSKSNRYLRKGGPRVHRRHRMSLPDDSDDSLLVDEMNEGPSTQWLRNRSGTPWPMGGLEMHGSTAWGLNVAASGWGYHGDNISSLTQGIQTAGQSSKGGADIQPLQVDESVSFEDIGGRFDREFVFPLPGFEARAEILTIHTRKWKEPPSKELKMELAASCVGYCGADLKSLCTEAAIRSFREKYPQVYTSDDKFVIDVDSIRVERHHFIEAMSTITPAAHRGSIVHSRPLSSIIAPCLQRHLLRIIECLSDIFPFLSTLDASKLSVLSYGSAIPLVYRPRLLICGGESAGLDHVGPAVLHELEKFPVHSLGLPSLLSDPSAKTPEEALVHIFSEARRTTPSILYLPQFHIWWETADQQLKSVLMTLLAELPSNLPVLLIGTSLVPLAEMDEDATSIFALSNMYQVDKPTANDRSQFWDTVVEALLSTQLDQSTSKLKEPTNLPQLSKAPKDANCPKPSELKAKIEAEQHALRRLRMCLRDVCNRILYDKRFSAFHYPVSDEDAPGYHSIVHNPIDIATMLQRVDCGQYLTRAAFSQDIDLIASNAKAYNKDDYNGARIVSRAYELLDVMQGMMAQMDPALVSFCDKISSQGGPLHLDGMEGLDVPGAPVVQLAAVTRTSARLRNVQPEVSLAQSFEAVKRQKKNPDNDHTGSEARTAPEPDSIKDSSHPQTEDQDASARVQLEDDMNNEQLEVSKVSTTQPIADENIADANISEQLDTVKQRFMERTEGYGIPELEHLYTRAIKCATAVSSKHGEGGKLLVLRHLLEFVEDDANF